MRMNWGNILESKSADGQLGKVISAIYDLIELSTLNGSAVVTISIKDGSVFIELAGRLIVFDHVGGDALGIASSWLVRVLEEANNMRINCVAQVTESSKDLAGIVVTYDPIE